VETGCAIERLGWDKVVVLMNTAHGDIRRLPFDLDRRRVLTYSLPDRRDDESQEGFWKRRAEARQQLLGTVTRALQVILDPAQERLGVLNLCGFLFHGSVEAVDSEAWTIRLVAPIGEHTLDPLELSSRLERAPQDFVATSRPGLARELSDRPTLRREGEHLIAVARVLPSQPRESASAIGRDIDLRSISNGDLAVTPGGVADIPRRLKQTLSIRRGGLVWQPAFGSFLSEYATDFDSSLLPDLIAAEVARLAFVPFAPGEPLALPFIRRVNSVQIGKGPNIQPMKVMFDLDVEPIGSWSGEAEVFLSPVEAMPRSGSR